MCRGELVKYRLARSQAIQLHDPVHDSHADGVRARIRVTSEQLADPFLRRLPQ